MFSHNCNNMWTVKQLLKLLGNTLENVSNGIIFGLLGTVFLLVFFLIAYSLNSFILPFMKIEDNMLTSMNISVTLILVAITAIYVFFTGEIVSESRKENKISFTEKRLECLYYPLLSVIEVSSKMEENNRPDEDIYPDDEYLLMFDKQDINNINRYRYLARKENGLIIRKILREALRSEVVYISLQDYMDFSSAIHKDVKVFNKKLEELIDD